MNSLDFFLASSIEILRAHSFSKSKVVSDLIRTSSLRIVTSSMELIYFINSDFWVVRFIAVIY